MRTSQNGGEQARGLAHEAHDQPWPCAALVEIDLLGCAKILAQHLFDIVHHALVREPHGDLEIYAERAVIEIHRADTRNAVIDQDDLFVQEPTGIAVHVDAVAHHAEGMGNAGKPDDQMVWLLWNQHAHVYAAHG